MASFVPTWVFKKADLAKGTACILSQDYGTAGAKTFAAFPDPAARIAYLEAHHGQGLYEVLFTDSLPCRLYFDIDLPGSADILHDTVHAFLGTLQRFLLATYDMDITWTIGTNCHIAEASSETKCSFHFVANAHVRSILQNRILAVAFIEYIVSNQVDALLYLNADNALRCAIDASVYSNFRSFRCLHMAKAGKRPLKPFAASSHNIADHMIEYIDGTSPPPLFRFPEITLSNTLPPKKTTRTKPMIVKQPTTTPMQDPPFIAQLRSYIANSAHLAELLRTGPAQLGTSYLYIRGHTHLLFVDRNCRPTCPFANRIHKSNHLYFIITDNKPLIRLTCFHEDCRKQPPLIIVPCESADILQATHNDIQTTTLHTQEHNIVWSQDYTEPCMRPYPIAPIVCIRAAMGVGKTVELRNLVRTQLPSTAKALFLTFSRQLAFKYAQDFAPHGFVNYMDVDHTFIQDSRVIVCLDSLHRILLRNPDYIFIDEALSVFLHLNSSLMTRTPEISTLLELLIRQAKHVYFLDACVDHALIVNVIRYFAQAKHADPVWIINRYVRPTNRTLHLATATFSGTGRQIADNPLAFAALQRIATLLDKKQRIVIASSTKRFTILAHDMIQTRYPDRTIALYNSDNQRDNSQPVDTSHWHTADVLIYSPSITAGVSFEPPHFDTLVAYLVNSPRTPTIDIALQQLFRVRQLNEGTMYIYTLDQPPANTQPLQDEAIESFLDADHAIVNRYFHANNIHFYAAQRIDGTTIAYDKERLSYQILKGIVMIQNVLPRHPDTHPPRGLQHRRQTPGTAPANRTRGHCIPPRATKQPPVNHAALRPRHRHRRGRLRRPPRRTPVDRHATDPKTYLRDRLTMAHRPLQH